MVRCQIEHFNTANPLYSLYYLDGSKAPMVWDKEAIMAEDFSQG